MFIVIYRKPHSVDPFYMRGTVFSSQKCRATPYKTVEQAREALAYTAKFNPRAVKFCAIVETDGEFI